MGLLRGLFPTLLILGLTACVDFAELGDSDRYKEDFHYSYALSPGGTVSVENANGSIDIAGWDQNTVDISGTKYASTKSNLDSIKIETSAAAGGVRVRTVRPEEWHGNGGARYTIKVPRKVLLDTISSTNGGIRVDDVDGNARLKSTNGSIRIHDLHGELNAHTTNGAMEADGLEGNANLETTNGSIKVDASHGSLEASTSNGAVTAMLADPVSNWPIKLHSTNGHIDLNIKSGKLPDVRAETSNSSITVHLPTNASARLRASTSHASVTSDFNVNAARGDSESKSELEGDIGGGGALLELTSTNGSIRILKN